MSRYKYDLIDMSVTPTDARKWEYYPVCIVTQYTGNKLTTSFEVWDYEETCYGNYVQLLDAVNQAMQLNRESERT